MPGLSSSSPPRRTTFRLAPRLRTFSDGASLLSGTPACLTVRSQNLEADFHSPTTTNPLPDPPRRGQNSCPASSALRYTPRLPGPLRSPSPACLENHLGLLRPEPVTALPCTAPACHAESPLPVRVCGPFGSMHSTPLADWRLTASHARSSFAPHWRPSQVPFQRIIVPAPLRLCQLAVP